MMLFTRYTCHLNRFRVAMAMVLTTVFLAARPCIAADDNWFMPADVLIVGGTESGCAAAVQAARMGVKKILLVKNIKMLGGQFSAEGLLAIDENRGPAGYDQTVPFPRAGMFKEVIERIEAINKQKYGRARPGNTRVITTCRPSDAHQAFEDLLQPYVDSGQVNVLYNYYPIAATVEGQRLTAVRFRSNLLLRSGGEEFHPEMLVKATVTIDATDWGDVIKAAGAAYEFGPDLKSKYGEPLAPENREGYPLTDMNPITYCMVINETDKYEPIPRPAYYDPRNYRSHKWPKDPLWLYESRRVIDHYNFKDVTHPDVLLLCFPAFDYPLDVHPQHLTDALEKTEKGASQKNIVQLSRAQRQLVFDDAKQYSLGFLHFLQTEIHDKMKDKTHSFRRFELTNEFGTRDRMPPKPYVRESLRLKAMYMMRQQDTMGYANNARNFANAMYHDGVACWQFEYDFHPTRRVFLENGDRSGPWICDFREGRKWGPPYSGLSLFPLRSLVPEKIDGLLGCQKNLGYSSIVSSAVRLHDQSMAIGTAVGGVAAIIVKEGVDARAIPYSRSLLEKLWDGLCKKYPGGIPHALWPFSDLEPEHPAFVAANQLAMRGGLPISSRDTKFRPGTKATQEWKDKVVQLSLAGREKPATPVDPPDGEMSRGEFVQLWWKQLKNMPDSQNIAYQRKSKQDADGDGVPDVDDALLFNVNSSTWTGAVLPAERDGNPDSIKPPKPNARLFNFTGKGSKAVDGYTNDIGLPYAENRGFGWSRDITANNRRRQQTDGQHRDTFLFTRSHDVWELAVENGEYSVTICVGDSGHEQIGQNVTIEGSPALKDVDTPFGEWAERTVTAIVKDGRLTVEIGRPDGKTNTCLNWLRVVQMSVADENEK